MLPSRPDLGAFARPTLWEEGLGTMSVEGLSQCWPTLGVGVAGKEE